MSSERRTRPWIVVAAGAYVLCGRHHHLAAASPPLAGAEGTPGRGGWPPRRPSFVATTTRSEAGALWRTRGGSTEEDGAATVIDEAAPASDDGLALDPADGAADNATAAVVAAAALAPEDASSDNAADAVVAAAALAPEDASVENATAAVVEGEALAPENASAATEALPRNLTFSATKPHDGSGTDPDGLPTRFLHMKKGDRAGAKACFAATLAWRAEHAVDAILGRPQPRYDVCKALVPHYFSGRDARGHVVFVQRPALLDFALMRRNNATVDELLLHYVFVIEYCWNILEAGPPEGVMTSVLDMRGLSFRSMKNQEYIGFGKSFVGMMSSHYPGRSYKTLVINAPKWFHALYKIFKPMLREATREKIEILRAGKKQDETLLAILGESLPRDLLSETAQEAHAPGTRYFMPAERREETAPGPNSLAEFDMRQLVIEQLQLHNETLQEVLCCGNE